MIENVVMVNKCAAPKCEANYKKLKTRNKSGKEDRIKRNVYHFPTDPELRKKWKNAVRRKNWSPSKHSVLCEKHFLPSDFKTERIDKNSSRIQNKGQKLKRKELKAGAIPSQLPDCPLYLSKTPVKERATIRSSSASRLQMQQLREQDDADKVREKDRFSSLVELDAKLDPDTLPPDVIVSYSDRSRMFLSVSEDGKPAIKYCLKISESLHFEMWCQGKKFYKKYFPDPEISTSQYLNSCNSLIKILNFLRENFVGCAEDVKTEKDLLNEIVDQLHNEKLCDNRKISFLTEQLSLVFIKPNARRYSSSLLAMAFMWQSISPALYRQVDSDGVLTLPSVKHVRALTSAVGADLKLTDPARKYLQTRFSKLKPDDHDVSLLMDEVYCKQTVQYTNGQFYGTDKDEIIKTLLCVMIKSICGKYQDVVSMTQISNISAEKIRIVWENCMSVLSEIGFIVVVTMTDGHKSNESFFKQLLGKSKDQFFIAHPYFPGQQIFLLFDPIHLFKNFYNNFMVNEIFSYPIFEDYIDSRNKDEVLIANFAHIRQLCDLELGKPVKMAHKLNDKVLNPCSLEKTNIKLADAVFHESTINALIYYSKHGYPEFQGTATFLQIIRDWFNTMNVKSAYNAQQTRNKRKECFRHENRKEITDYLNKFSAWIKKWQEDPELKGFSKPTFSAAIQTSSAIPRLLNYLLDKTHMQFILTGHIQSDFLESRFGWYRQLCGANYYNSVLQFLQAEKTIRIRSLVKMGFSLSNIKDIFENENTEDLDSSVMLMLENIENFSFEEPLKDEDQSIVYALSGFIAKKLIKHKSNCQDCSDFLSPGKVPFQLEFEDGLCSPDEVNTKEEFIRDITKGGLIKPSDALYILCTHSHMMYTFIVNDKNKKQVLLSTSNPRNVFVETFIQKCEDNEYANIILESKCGKGHSIKHFITEAIATMFNLFAKNLISEKTSEIHKTRKRKVKIKDAKKVANARKLKKLTSN